MAKYSVLQALGDAAKGAGSYFGVLSAERRRMERLAEAEENAAKMRDENRAFQKELIADAREYKEGQVAKERAYQEGLTNKAREMRLEDEARDNAEWDRRQDIQLKNTLVRKEAERKAKNGNQDVKAFNKLEATEQKSDMLSDLVQKAKEDANLWTTGFLGEPLSRIPGTPAANLSATLDTLKSNAGFDRLQQMREQSRNGSAVGNVTEKELVLLQSSWTSLSQSQSPEQFVQNLDRFEVQVRQSLERAYREYEIENGHPHEDLLSGQTVNQPDFERRPIGQMHRRRPNQTEQLDRSGLEQLSDDDLFNYWMNN